MIKLYSREREEVHDDGHAGAVVLDGLFERRPRVAAVGADRVEERLYHHRLSPRRRLPAVHEPVRPRRNRELRAAAHQACTPPPEDRQEQKRDTPAPDLHFTVTLSGVLLIGLLCVSLFAQL